MTARPWGEHSGRDLTVRVAVLVLASLALVVAARGAKTATYAGAGAIRSAADSGRPAVVSTFEDVRRQLAEAVPPGRTVVVDGRAGALWSQRLAEFAVMSGIRVTDDPAQADFRVSVTGGPGAPTRLVAEPLR